MNNFMNQLKENFLLQGLLLGSAVLLCLLVLSPSYEVGRQSRVAEFVAADVAELSLAASEPGKKLSPPDMPQNFLVSVEPGDTLADILQEKKISRRQSFLIVRALTKYVNPRKIKVGQKISILVKEDAGVAEMLRLSIAKDKVNHVEVVRQKDGSYKASLVAKDIKQVSEIASIPIEGSVYVSAKKKGVPTSVINQLVAAYSYDVNFQKDVKSGDSLCVYYEKNLDSKTGKEESSSLVYASLKVGSRNIPIYVYETNNGLGFYYKNGQSVKKTFLATPIKGARVSSGFGVRIHPISGRRKFHSGVDFAARRGTQVLAAADGKITRSSWYGGYGRCIEVRHSNGYSTLYGHLNGYAKGIAPGAKVYQGKPIGFVGSTGMSTGPHLHFELRKHGVPINPKQQGLHAPTFALTGGDLNRFKTHSDDVDARVKESLSVQDL